MNPDYFKYHSATYYDTTYKEPTHYASPELYFRDIILEKLDSLKERIERKYNCKVEIFKNRIYRINKE